MTCMFMLVLNQEGGAKVGLPSFFWVFGSPKLSPDKIVGQNLPESTILPTQWP